MSHFNNIQEDQLHNIDCPHAHDVLSGRGNYVNCHQGNEYFRTVVKDYEQDYASASKHEKKQFASMIVDQIKSRNPPGRFLKLSVDSRKYYDIGCKKALEKTRQALRENVPEIFKTQIAPEGSFNVNKSIGKLQNSTWSANILSSENTKDTVTPPSVSRGGSTSSFTKSNDPSSNSVSPIHIANTTRTNVAFTGDTIKRGSDNGNNRFNKSFNSTANVPSLRVQNTNTFQKSGYASTPLSLSLTSEDNIIHNNNPTSDQRIVGTEIINPGGSFRTEIQHEVISKNMNNLQPLPFLEGKESEAPTIESIEFKRAREKNMHSLQPLPFLRGKESETPAIESIEFKRARELERLIKEAELELRELKDVNTKLHLTETYINHTMSTEQRGEIDSIYASNETHPRNSEEVEELLPLGMPKRQNSFTIDEIFSDSPSESSMDVSYLKLDSSNKCMASIRSNQEGIIESTEKNDDCKQSNGKSKRLSFFSLCKDSQNIKLMTSVGELSILSKESNEDGGGTLTDEDYKQSNGKSKKPSFFSLCKDSDNMNKLMTSVGEMSILSKESNEDGGEQDGIRSLCFPNESIGSESISKKSSRENHSFEHINGDPDLAKMFTSIGEISNFSAMTDESKRSKETQNSSDMSFQIETLDKKIFPHLKLGYG